MRDPLDRPNIVLINCDDLGWGDLACTGHPLHQTPYLDRLAREGARFTNFYQPSAVCSPSRGGMLTGCYPRRIGFDNFEGKHVLFPGQRVGLATTEITFAKLLQSQGYATQMLGKWHCGDQPEFLPTRHGFDEYFGLPYSNDMGRQGQKWNPPPLPLLDGETVIEAQPDQASLTQRYTEHAVRFMRRHRGEPFIVYLAHMHVHLPLYVPDRFLRDSANGRYGASVECVDWSTGVILHTLRQLGLEQNTLVMFTSDNGSRCDFGASNGHLRGKKGSTWEGGARVPLLARWPGVIPAGVVRDDLTTGMDLLPTFAELAGAKVPDDRALDGQSLMPLMRGGPISPAMRHYLYYGMSSIDAIRDDRWKLHVGRQTWTSNDRNLCELYDLQNDPGETTDIANQNMPIVRALMAQLDRSRDDLGDAATHTAGRNRRPIGRVDDPRPLTTFDPDCPYFMATYDLTDAG